jgi:hypothetical protein
MRTRHLLVAAAIGAAALIPATASAATLRVVSDGQNVFGAKATDVTSARSYTDSKGKRHVLKANTAMGQIVATGLPYTAVFDASYNAAYLTRLVGVKAATTGYWAFFVNGTLSMTGATDATLKSSDEVVWLVDSDYSTKNGPYAYNLDAKTNANGTVTFSATRIGSAKAIVAGGAPLLINGAKVGNLAADGTLTITPTGAWTAQIPAKGKIAASETLAG